MISVSPIEQRKLDHININLEQDVDAREVTTGFERFRFVHNALPDLHVDDIDTGTCFLGKALAAPLLISSMTGGVNKGQDLTRRLASVAQICGCAIGVGSQRAGIEDPANARFFRVRDVAPDVLLFANLGAVQLNYGFGVEECRRAIDMIQADGLILHLNPLQEALQANGNRDFSGLTNKIEQICRLLDAPVIVKEVGFGFSTDVARRLANCGVAAIDTAGAGGTSWSAVEHYRAPNEALAQLGGAFIDWGIPTSDSIRMVRAGAPEVAVIASGGLRTGIDVAKALALGASLAGIAGPLLRAAAQSEERAFQTLKAIIQEIRLVMFCTGSPAIAALGPDLLMPECCRPSTGDIPKTEPWPVFSRASHNGS